MSALPDFFDSGEQQMDDGDRPWRWPMLPPEDGFKAEDLDRIENLPAHTELIDGNLVLVSPQRSFHALTISLLEFGLRAQSPAQFRVRREISVTLSSRQRPESDVLVVTSDAITGKDQTTFKAADVQLAVEVVSPDSLVRDRERKPQLYAQAGIPHFWRVEEINGHPTVYTYELDQTTGSYAVTGIHHDHLRVALPFQVNLDLTEIDQL